MQMKIRKLWPIFGLVCIGLLSTASAQPYSNLQSDSMSSQGSQDMSQGTYQRGTYREITPNAGPRVAHGADVFITADFIYWKAVQEGTDVGTTGGVVSSDNSSLVNASRGTIRSVGNAWASGFKVGLGLNLFHDGWDLYSQYTWLQPDNSTGLTHTLPIETSTLSLGYTSASAHWSFHFNTLDLELGRNFYLSQFLTMRPFIGLKGTWQKQDTRSHYYNTNGFDVASSVNITGPYNVHQRNHVWGLGTRGGFDISWYLSKNWSVFGNMAWTALWTNYTKLTRKDTVDNTDGTGNGNSPVQVNLARNNYYTVRWIGESELGLRWETWFSDDNYHFAVQAGWEEQVWLNWSTPLPEAGIRASNWKNLNFQGLNLKLRFDF
jgi:hypothetical protein